MKCSVKGLWETILVATALDFFRICRERYELEWGVVSSSDKTLKRLRADLYTHSDTNIFPNAELWKGTEQSWKIGSEVGENMLQWKTSVRLWSNFKRI